MRTPIERFNRFICKEDRGFKTMCWIWTGAKTTKQRPVFIITRTPEGKQIRAQAHRWLWEQRYGPIPEGLHLHHRCEQTLCVRPMHLKAVTPQQHLSEHNHDIGAYHRGKTHCVQGHKFTKKNTRYRTKKDGHQQRVCRACQAEAARKFRAK